MKNIAEFTFPSHSALMGVDSAGMRPMQARVYRQRSAQYLLVKAPPASGKSRALMYVALEKLVNQTVRKVIIAVPERSIGKSFASAPLSKSGFHSDWEVNGCWNLCVPGTDGGVGARSKVKAFKSFLESDDQILVCTHATLRYAHEQLGTEVFDEALVAIDEFHHASSSDANRLGEVVRRLMGREKAHLLAMTGSYFRGDAQPVMRPQDELRFTTVTYTYFEQLSGYTYLKSLAIGYHFYTGSYIEGLKAVLDPDLKTIIHIPSVNSAESTKMKNDEVAQILSALGDWVGIDPDTGFYLIRSKKDGRELKVADLVDDNGEREKILASLRALEDRDAVDIVIALGMAKEGFDWIWCQHALTIGRRNSLTEIIQIIGRATRDAPGKTFARFTNLISEPDAAEELTISAANDLFKAIALSLLMVQIVAPKMRFHATKKGEIGFDLADGKNDPLANSEDIFRFDPEEGVAHIRINGISEPKSEHVRRICENELDNILAVACQDNLTAAHAAANPDMAGATFARVHLARAVADVYPELSAEEQEVVRQHAVAYMTFAEASTKASAEKNSNDAFLKITQRFIKIDELEIDLIERVNPLAENFEVISKDLSAERLGQIQNLVAGQHIPMTEKEVCALWPEVLRFRDRHQREPQVTSEDASEARLGKALQFAAMWKLRQMKNSA